MSNINHGNVCLRPWRVEDAGHLIAIAKCAHVQAWLKDWDDVEAWATPWIEGQARHHEKDNPEADFMSWAITVSPSGEPIGCINFGGDEMDHRGVSLGYFLHEDALHKGYATEAVEALCQYAFEHWDYSEIFANAREDNGASRAVLERAGFELLDIRSTQLPGYEGDMPCAWYVIRKKNCVCIKD